MKENLEDLRVKDGIQVILISPIQKSFLFSLDLYQCYYYNTGNAIYGSSSYGPLWGSGHDLYLASGCLSNNSSKTNQSASYNYYGKTYCLSGGANFQAIDYETYELVFE